MVQTVSNCFLTALISPGSSPGYVWKDDNR
jgi:hypothetical protein